MKQKPKPQAALCPCGSGETLILCCRPYHEGELAPNAERLMRSRYSAYALGLETYLLETWHPSTRPDQLDLSADPIKWIGLKIIASTEQVTQANVTFQARYKVGGKAGRLNEKSRFILENGRWFYLDGDVDPS